MDDILRKRLKRVAKKSEEYYMVRNNKTIIKKRVFDKYEDCELCKGTLYTEDDKPCECKSHYILSKELKRCGVGENFIDVNLDFYEEYLSSMLIRVKKGLKGKTLKKTFGVDYLTRYLTLYSETFVNRLNDGRGFILAGDCGGGKTSAVVWVLVQLCKLNYRRQFDSNIRVDERKLEFMFIDTLELLDLIKDTWDSDSPTKHTSKRRLNMMSKVHLLIIDDLGAEYTKTMDWLLSIFLKVIKGRSNENLPTLITTNFTPEQLAIRFNEKEFPRLSSILTEKFEVILMENADDVRQVIAEENDLLDVMTKEVR